MTIGLHERIRRRLHETGKAARRASLDGGLSEYAISKILRTPEHSQTLETIGKLAEGLDTTPLWLAYGIGEPSEDSGTYVDRSRLSINVHLLKQAVEFVLLHEGIGADRAALVADILPEALSGPPVDAVERDPFLSFRVHFQLGDAQSSRPEPR